MQETLFFFMFLPQVKDKNMEKMKFGEVVMPLSRVS
jgi:hypothetical protein